MSQEYCSVEGQARRVAARTPRTSAPSSPAPKRALLSSPNLTENHQTPTSTPDKYPESPCA